MRYLVPALVLGSVVAAADAAPSVLPVSQIELGGTSIGEARASIEKRLGKPSLSGTMPDGLEYWAYQIDTKTQLVVTFETFRRDFAFGVQQTGRPSAKATPFLGVKLGDTRATLDATLGPPSQVKGVEDPEVADLGLSLLTYAGRNYTFEVGKDQRIYSIRINGYDGWTERFGWSSNWGEYEPASFALGLKGIADLSTESVGKNWVNLDARLLKIRPRVVFLGEIRATRAAERDLIDKALAARNITVVKPEMYTHAIKVAEAGQARWLPIQGTLVEDFRKEVQSGEAFDVFAIVIGRSRDIPEGLFAVNEFQIY